MEKLLGKIKDRELQVFCIATMLFLFISAFLLESPEGIWQGMLTIIWSRDALITDYFDLANYGAALFNAALVLGMGIFLTIRLKMTFTGLTMAVLFINVGFALFGKNPLNVLPIILGTYLYARAHRVGMNRYVYTALFGSCLAPLVTEMGYLIPGSFFLKAAGSIAIGIFIGFVLPPLSMHSASMHMGYNLFNMGFAAGLLAFVIVCIFDSIGLSCSTIFIWKAGRPLFLVMGMYGYFLAAMLFGLLVNRGNMKGIFKLMRHPGRAVADFVLMDGVGTTLFNMGLVGIICVTYIIMIGGDMSGPVMGAILTAFGFAAFGAHPRNFVPVLAGVYISTLFNRFEATTPGIQMAAAFAVGLAPIAGQFGVFAGVIAGVLHAAVVMSSSGLYGGLNLYNNGFSTGLVAIVMVPVLESFMKRFEARKNRRKEKNRGMGS